MTLKYRSTNWKVLLLLAFLTPLSCGIETILIVLPAISATWCVENDPCHKFELRTGQDASDTKERGNVGGAEYFLSDGDKFKFGDLSIEGENFIIGTYNGLNIEFAVHYRLSSNFEEYYVGSIELLDSGGKKMYLENLTTGEKFVLSTSPCNC